MGGDADAGFFGFLEEGLDGDSGAVGTEATVVLFVTFGCGVVWVEAADSVVVISSVFAESIGEGEAEVSPVVVSGCDVGVGGFDA